jgi:tripartite-type tricarboxylate transporter receptor subunit TctC
MICPYPAGGVTDLGVRTLAEAMEKDWKQPVVVVNKVGGAPTVGGYGVSSAKPDGYTHRGKSLRDHALPQRLPYVCPIKAE